MDQNSPGVSQGPWQLEDLWKAHLTRPSGPSLHNTQAPNFHPGWTSLFHVCPYTLCRPSSPEMGRAHFRHARKKLRA